MKKLITVVLILSLVIMSAIALAKNTDADPKNSGTIDNLKYLVGVWQMTTYKNTHIQKWELQNDRTLTGTHSVVHGKDTLVYAKMTVAESDSGLILSGNATMMQLSMRFKETAQDSTTTKFTNLGTEFPTTVTCGRRGTDSLYAKTEGVLNGAPKTTEFYFVRVPGK